MRFYQFSKAENTRLFIEGYPFYKILDFVPKNDASLDAICHVLYFQTLDHYVVPKYDVTIFGDTCTLKSYTPSPKICCHPTLSSNYSRPVTTPQRVIQRNSYLIKNIWRDHIIQKLKILKGWINRRQKIYYPKLRLKTPLPDISHHDVKNSHLTYFRWHTENYGRNDASISKACTVQKLYSNTFIYSPIKPTTIATRWWRELDYVSVVGCLDSNDDMQPMVFNLADDEIDRFKLVFFEDEKDAQALASMAWSSILSKTKKVVVALLRPLEAEAIQKPRSLDLVFIRESSLEFDSISTMNDLVEALYRIHKLRENISVAGGCEIAI